MYLDLGPQLTYPASSDTGIRPNAESLRKHVLLNAYPLCQMLGGLRGDFSHAKAGVVLTFGHHTEATSRKPLFKETTNTNGYDFWVF